MDKITLKVAAASHPATVAGAIANNVREDRLVELVAMGASSVNQAVKAIAISRDYLKDDKIELSCQPEFIHLILDGQEKSALRFVILPRRS